VVIFISDGECEVEDATIYDLCHTAARLGCVLRPACCSRPEPITENHFPSMLYLLVKMGNHVTFAEWPQSLARYTIIALLIRLLLLVWIHALSALH
jgi:hypothetical protein